MKPTDKLKVIKSDCGLDRVEYCRSFLYLHGFITDSQNENIKKKVKKWCDNYGVAVIKQPLISAHHLDHVGLLPSKDERTK